MVREDILSGLRNALERGHSMSQAKQTLINSGYSPQDVQDAVNFIEGRMPSSIQRQNFNAPEITAQNTSNQEERQIQSLPVMKNTIINNPRKKSKVTLIIMIFFLVLLVGILVASLLYKEKIAEFLNSLFS